MACIRNPFQSLCQGLSTLVLIWIPDIAHPEQWGLGKKSYHTSPMRAYCIPQRHRLTDWLSNDTKEISDIPEPHKRPPVPHFPSLYPSRQNNIVRTSQQFWLVDVHVRRRKISEYVKTYPIFIDFLSTDWLAIIFYSFGLCQIALKLPIRMCGPLSLSLFLWQKFFLVLHCPLVSLRQFRAVVRHSSHFYIAFV